MNFFFWFSGSVLVVFMHGNNFLSKKKKNINYDMKLWIIRTSGSHSFEFALIDTNSRRKPSNSEPSM